jgi:hypothetical protein
MRNEFAVVVQYRTKDSTLVQTGRFTDVRVDGYGARVQVQGRSEISAGRLRAPHSRWLVRTRKAQQIRNNSGPLSGAVLFM